MSKLHRGTVAAVFGAIFVAGSLSMTMVRTDAAPAQPAALISYSQWRFASPREKEAAVASAIAGIHAGWVYGYAHAFGDLQAALIAEQEKGRVAPGVVGSLAPSRTMSDLRFSKPLSIYRGAIDRAYASQRLRTADIAGVLLCLADVPAMSCSSDK